MEPKESKLSIPLAIIFAGILIAGSVIYSLKGGGSAVNNQNGEVADQGGSLDEMREISSSDHIRGSIDAPVVIVEYSDTECPFCKQFHASMKQVVNEYGGKVAWVYRSFPLEQLHSKAKSEAVALECAAELGGNEKFWQYTDRIYETTPANNGLDPAELPKIAAYVGLNVSQFNTCLQSGKYDSKIEADIQDAIATGGRGTPWSIVVKKGGEKFELSGAQPYTNIKQIVDSALK